MGGQPELHIWPGSGRTCLQSQHSGVPGHLSLQELAPEQLGLLHRETISKNQNKTNNNKKKSMTNNSDMNLTKIMVHVNVFFIRYVKLLNIYEKLKCHYIMNADSKIKIYQS